MTRTISHITGITIAALAALTIGATVSTAMPSPEYVSRAAAKAQQDRPRADAHAVPVRPQTGTAIPPQTGTAIPPQTGTAIPPETSTPTLRQSPSPSDNPAWLAIALSIGIPLVLVTVSATHLRRLRLRRRRAARVTS